MAVLLAATISFTACAARARLSDAERAELIDKPEKVISEAALEFYNAGRYRKAIDTYRLILDNPDAEPKYRLWAQYEIAFSFYRMDDFEKAEKEFQKVLEMFPDTNIQERAPRILAEKMINKIQTGDVHI